MNYGLPYKGSKNKIAEKIVDFLPKATNLYDLFAGGCAITHCAMLSGKWQNYVINDIEPGITQLFADAANGKFRNESRWIGRDTFHLLKDSDPYVRYCWSFGNNGESYLYAPEAERFKKHLHNIFFSKSPKEARLHWKKFVREFQLVRDEIEELTGKVEALCKECGVDVLRDSNGLMDAKRLRGSVFKVLSGDIRGYMRNALKESGYTAADVDKLLGTNGMAGHYFGASQWALPTEEAYKKMQQLIPGLVVPWASLRERLQSLESLERLERLQSLERLESLQSLQSLERLERLQSLQSLERLERLERYSQSYDKIKIEPDSVIYCDIPYRGCSGYGAAFDYDSFYDWACSQDAPVFISEYSMPEDRFVCVKEMAHTCSLSATATGKVTERLFVPKH